MKGFKHFAFSFVFAAGVLGPAAAQARLHPLEEKEASELKSKLFLSVAFAKKAGQTKLRGTHSKGACLTGSFEVLDPSQTPDVPADELQKIRIGLFQKPAKYPVRMRFANALGQVDPDQTHDPRALSFAVDLGRGKRQDFVVQNMPIFPIPSLADFVLLINFVNPDGANKDLSKFTPEEQARIVRILKLGSISTKDPKSYRTETYWSGVAFALGENNAAKYVVKPCATNNNDLATDEERKSNPNYMIEDLARYTSSRSEPNCFEFRIQPLKADVMTSEGQTLAPQKWVEDPTLVWNESEAPSYLVAKLQLDQSPLLDAAQCDSRDAKFSVGENTLKEHRALGRINRGRTWPESASAIARTSGALKAFAWIKSQVVNGKEKISGWFGSSEPELVPTPPPAAAAEQE